METKNEGELFPEPKRGLAEILKSYFYWTYPRGCFHYDVMVTLILLFIFVTPHLWNYGDKPSSSAGLRHPIQLTGDGESRNDCDGAGLRCECSGGSDRLGGEESSAAGYFAGDRRCGGCGALGNDHRRPGKYCLEDLGAPVEQ